VPLAPEYSLAVDRRFVPLGAPIYLATTYPLSDERLERLMAAHDTGGAIRGPIRADFFWGSGPEAGSLAGRMRQQGSMWLLWPRGEPLPRID
jgi:membrane-bound lytic murein transglycosylase A